MSLPDLIRAIKLLEATGEDEGAVRARIAVLLGIPAAEVAARREPSKPPPLTSELAHVAPEPPTPQVMPTATPAPQPEARSEVDLLAVGGKRTATPVAPRSPIAGALQAAATPLVLAPLFRPPWTRALLSTMLARPGVAGPLDIERLVDRFARLQVIQRLLRRRTPTLSRGTQVLLDVGGGLGPFARDARELIARIRVVAGSDRTEVLHFRASPLLVTAERSFARGARYTPPRPGTQVLAISDLGLAPVLATAADLVEAWLELDALLRAADCALLVLTPYPASRWPAPLARRLTLLEWDRPTSVAAVRRVLGGAR